MNLNTFLRNAVTTMLVIAIVSRVPALRDIVYPQNPA